MLFPTNLGVLVRAR